MVSSLGKRLKAAASTEKWDVTVRVASAAGLPEWAQLVEVQLRRGSLRSARHQSSPAAPSAAGAARWAHSFGIEATIYRRANGQAVPKPCELVLLGAAGAGHRMRKVGAALLDLSEFCADPRPPRAQHAFLLSLESDCVLKVAVSARNMSDLSCQTSELSCGSYLSEMSLEDGTIEGGAVRGATEGAGQKSRACSLRGGQGNPALDDSAHVDLRPPAHKRWNPFEADPHGGDEEAPESIQIDTAYFLGALASSDSDDDAAPEQSLPARRWSWLKRKGRRATAPAASSTAASPDHNSTTKMGSALRVAQAGPVASPIDIRRIESESDPEALRCLLRRLFADREELAFRNWALDATNRCLDAELEDAQLKGKQLEQSLGSSNTHCAELQREVESLRSTVAAAQLRSREDKLARDPARIQVGELHSELAAQKTRVAQAEFELMGLRQELRASRRATQESTGSSQCRSPSPRELTPDDSCHDLRPGLASGSDDADLHEAVVAIHRALSGSDGKPTTSLRDAYLFSHR